MEKEETERRSSCINNQQDLCWIESAQKTLVEIRKIHKPQNFEKTKLFWWWISRRKQNIAIAKFNKTFYV